MNRRNHASLLEGPVGASIVRLAGPMAVGIAAVLGFNLVHIYFVGRLGPRELAAVSFTFPVSFVVTGIAIGLSVGTTSVVSRAIGRGDESLVRRLATDSLVLSVLLVVAVAGAGLLALEPMFLALGASPELLGLIAEFMVPWFAGVGLLVVPMVGNGAVRATGDTKTPSLIMIAAGLVNLALDPLFIFGLGPVPRLGLRGAAYASIASWSISFFGALYVLGRRERLLDFTAIGVERFARSFRSILEVGVPAIATQMLVPLAAAVFTRFVAAHGERAVAGYGVGTRVESVALLGVMALSTGLAPFVGQNFGAGLHRRVRHALSFSVRAAFVLGTASAVALVSFRDPLARVFAGPEAATVIDTAKLYFWLVPASYGFFGVAVVVNAMFNAVNKPLVAVGLTFARVVVLGIPLAWAGSRWFGIPGIFVGIAVGNGLSAILSFVLARRFLDTLELEAVAANAPSAG